MNQNRSRRYLVALLNFIIFAILLLAHYSGAFQISAIRANPVTLIPFLVAFSFFNEEWASAFTGMAVGIFMDCSVTRFSFFNTVVIMLIGLFSSLIVRHLFNNNLRSAIALSLIATLFYFVLRWILFHAVGGSIEDSIFYLMYYALPSVIYTALFIIPFYYLQKKFYEIKTG